MGCDDVVDFVQRHIFFQFDRQCLRMATHCTDTHAQAIDRDRGLGIRAECISASENLVGFRPSFPFFTRNAITQILIDPWNQVAAKRYAELPGFVSAERMLFGEHLAVDFKDRRCRIVEQRFHFRIDRTKLRQQLAHMLRAAT